MKRPASLVTLPITAAYLAAASGESCCIAIRAAKAGPVAEGSTGGGNGMIAYEFKAGTGTASRRVSLGGKDYTVGALVQANHGQRAWFQVLGRAVGQAMPEGSFRRKEQGSIIVVIATDAPLSDRNLQRLAARAIMGLSRTGSSASNGSGDYVLAFSTSEKVRRRFDARQLATEELANEPMSALFQATVEATEEALYNSLFMATTTTANGRTIRALPLDSVKTILTKYGVR